MTEEKTVVEHQVDAQECKCQGCNKCTLKTWHLFVLGIVGILAVASIIVYAVVANSTKHLSQNKFVLKMAQVFSLPAAKINNLKVAYTDYIDDLNTLNKFYSTNPAGFAAVTPEQISDQVLSRLVANRLIANVAEQYKVTISNEELEKAKATLLSKFPDQNQAETELMKTYGWTLQTYLAKVVKPLLLEQKLQGVFASSTDAVGKKYEEKEANASHILFMLNKGDKEEVVKAKAQKVLDQLKAGADFVVLAKQYGSDSTKDNGGELGWFGKGQMVPEFEEAVFAAEPGKLIDHLVQTQYGFHIIKINEVRTARNFLSFMDEKLKDANIKILIDVHNPFEAFQKGLTATSTTK